MLASAQVKDNVLLIEPLPDQDLEPKSIREKILENSEKMRRGERFWVQTAKLLEYVQETKMFEDWEFDGFRDYCAKELWYGKTVAYDLISALRYTRLHFSSKVSDMTDTSFIPEYNAINILRRAEPKVMGIHWKELVRIREQLFNGEVYRDELKKKLKEILPPREQKEEITEDPQITALKNQVADLKKKLRKVNNDLKRFSQSNLSAQEVNKFYKQIMNLVHPDKGGSTEVTQLLNDFFDKLRAKK